MKHLRISIILAVAFLLVNTLFSQSLLWKVSGGKQESPSYLYGTIHIQDERVFSFDSTVLNALLSCEAFAGELLLDEINMSGVSQAMMMPKGQLLSDMLSKEDFALLDKMCKKKLGVSAIFMNRMKPFFLASALQQADIPQDKDAALDLYLLNTARAGNKRCYGLEEYMDQINAIDAISVKVQLQMLKDMLKDNASMAEDFGELLRAYRSFDFDNLLKMMYDSTTPKKFYKVFLDKRNVAMMKRFIEITDKNTLFCAVGAAHLAGKKGIIALLRKKGYTVEPVPFSWIDDTSF